MDQSEIDALAKRCGIVPHPDPAVTLSAVNKYISQEETSRMDTSDGGGEPQDGPKHFKLNSFPPGCAPTGNKKVDDAVRVMRLIHVHRQRHLQTQINEILSNVQHITGDPKADLTIGRVGR